MENLRKVLFFIIITCPLLLPANGWPKSYMIGKWQFIGIIFDDVYQDRPNPNLILTFEFNSDGTDILHWKRVGEDGFCERHGQWSLENGVLEDEVVWVNPNNNDTCASDPDMQLGKISYTPVWVADGKLYTEFPFADKVMIYVWDNIDEDER